MKLFIFFICALALSSCGKFEDGGGSVWQAGLWIIPWLTGLASLFFWYKAGKQHVGGSWKIIGGWISNQDGGRIPIWKTPYFIFAAGLTIATIIIIIMVNSDK